MKPRDIVDVAEGHLCTGCGVCAYLEPETVTMVDIVDKGLRPSVSARGEHSPTTLACCPGAGLTHDYDRTDPAINQDLQDVWGPVYGVWEGYASDENIRWRGSSAGAATVLSAFCLEEQGMEGVVHIKAREDVAYLNETTFSTTVPELVAATGSRYAPASPCTGLDSIEKASAPCVFIGKPCDVAATQRARRYRPDLDRNLGLVIGIFCAGTPSTHGTLEMLRQMGVDPNLVTDVKYRGQGWPGLAEAKVSDGSKQSLTYEQSWGDVLQKHRQWRCYVCADHTGEFADVAVGDPWYREVDGKNPGQSLVVARTPRGKEIVEAAIDAGYLTASRVSHDLLPRSQPNLQSARGSVWGRIQMLRLFRAYAPRYQGLPMAHIWLRELSLRQKLQSTVGTVRRIRSKALKTRAPVGSDAPRYVSVGTQTKRGIGSGSLPENG